MNLSDISPYMDFPVQAPPGPAPDGLTVAVLDRHVGHGCLGADAGRLALMPAGFPVGWGNCDCDFQVLLTDVLARLANCTVPEVDSELEACFWRICEFLELHCAGLWSGLSHDPGSFTLTHLYPKPAPRAHEGNSEMGSGESSDWVLKAIGSWPLLAGRKLDACFPWLGLQVRRGATVVPADLTQLPAEAGVDKDALGRLGVRSIAAFPLRAEGKVVGVFMFGFSGGSTGWPGAAIERLKLVTQVLGAGVARKLRADDVQAAAQALARSCAEVRQLKARLQAESECLTTDGQPSHAHNQVLGQSAGIRRVLHQTEQVAPVDCPVLITGETGTGKELVAQEIHQLSGRRARAMVLVNCAALPSALVESELFGRERGAYTGALTSQVGRFEMANGSTIFLDEVGELSMEVQAKLLRVLQEGEFQRLGSPKTHKVAVRVIAATNRDLTEAVRKGRFRQDLYYRLKVFPIAIPPLRERVEDIPLLVFSFLQEFSRRMGKKITRIPRKAMETLQAHSWPGNIRELRNVIQHSAVLTTGDTLKLAVLSESPSREVPPATLAEAEREHILTTLKRTAWRIKGPHGAAARLALQPSTLYSRMQKLGIPHRRQKDAWLTLDGSARSDRPLDRS